MHEDEEIRYILSGSGFFDVRGEAWPWSIQDFTIADGQWPTMISIILLSVIE
jgi:hypothetical protein